MFRNASNPIRRIRTFNPEAKENCIFDINTYYQRHTSTAIRRGYYNLIRRNKFLENIDNIAEVTLIAKGIYRTKAFGVERR